MKAPAFAYVRADNLDQVFEAFQAHGEDAQILASGQSLMPTLNLRLAALAFLPSLINCSAVPLLL